MEKQRLEIDTLRGLACVLLVLLHVVGNTPAAGLTLPADHWLHGFNRWLAFVRMPLFAFISGFVYACRPWRGDTASFIRGKAMRLLLPMVTIGTAFAVLQALVPGAHRPAEPWYLMHILPVAHFWFIEALFVIFMVMLLLERQQAIDTPAGLALVFTLAVALFLWLDPPNYFAIRSAVYLLPFFLGGLACKRFRVVPPPAVVWGALVCAAAMVLFYPDVSDTLSSPVALAFGLSGAYLLLHSGVRWAALAYLGSCSFAIYLLHPFFTGASRIFFGSMGLTGTYELLLLGMALGIAGPIGLLLVIEWFKRLRLRMPGTFSKPAEAPVASRF